MGNVLLLFLSIIISFIPGVLGSFATIKNIPTWYKKLRKPFFNPPNSIFGPVWTVLYILMGISLFFFWKASGGDKTIGYIIFAIQLILNGLWSFIFFGWHKLWIGFIEILCMWLAILATIIVFWQNSQLAALLLIPYLAWVSFASILNFSVARMNTK